MAGHGKSIIDFYIIFCIADNTLSLDIPIFNKLKQSQIPEVMNYLKQNFGITWCEISGKTALSKYINSYFNLYPNSRILVFYKSTGQLLANLTVKDKEKYMKF